MVTFDARAAKALKAGDHLTIENCPGLRLEAAATRRTWIYRYKSPADGRMRQVRIGHWPVMSVAAAVAEWEQLRARRDAGEDLARTKRGARQAEKAAVAEKKAQRAEAAYTLAKACITYIDARLEGVATPKYVREQRRTVATMLGDDADLPAATYTRRQAFALIERHAAIPVQAKRLKQLLGAAWDYSLDADLLPETAVNWWRLIMRGQLKSQGKSIAGQQLGATKRVLSPVELGEVIRFLPNVSRLVGDVLTLYLWTCCRGSEICAMEAHEVRDEADGLWWIVPVAKLKMRRNPMTTDLRVPLVGRAEVVVRRRLQQHPEGWLFPSTGVDGHVLQKTIQTAVHYHQAYSRTRPEDERPRWSVTHWAPHDLRRTGRTQLAALGCPEEVAEAILGHRPPGVVGVYNLHQYDAERRRWLRALSARLEELAAAFPHSGAAASPTPVGARPSPAPRGKGTPPAPR